MIVRRLVALLCLLVLAVPAAAAEAAPPRSAERFADAGLRLTIAVKALKPQLRTSYEAIDVPRCSRVLGRDIPDRHTDRAYTVFAVAIIQPLIDLGLPPMQQMLRDLEAIPTSDIALRRGRAAWRKTVALFAAFPRLDDPCGALEAWADAKWSPAAAPKVSPADFERFEKQGGTVEAKLKAAARRLRQLGITRRAAERFTGEKAFEDALAESAVEDALGESAEGGGRETPPARPVRD